MIVKELLVDITSVLTKELDDIVCEEISLSNLIHFYFDEITMIVDGDKKGSELFHERKLRAFTRQGVFFKAYNQDGLGGIRLCLTDNARRIYDRLKEEKQ